MNYRYLPVLAIALLAAPARAQTQPTVSLLTGGVPYVDGPAGTGRYQQASGLYVDAAGNLLFTDRYQVRQLSGAGVLSTVAGLPRSGGVAGSPPNTLANLWHLTGDAAGNLYASTYNSLLKITPAGQVSQVLGAPLANVAGLVRTANGDVYTVESSQENLLRKVAANGTATVLAGIKGKAGRKDGPLGTNRVGTPRGLVLNTDGNFYFTDLNVIRQYNPTTGYLRTIAGDTTDYTFADGQGQQAHFGSYCQLALAPGGNLYVTDPAHYCLRLVTPAGVVTTVAGNPTAAPGYQDGTGLAARFENPGAMALLPGNDLLVAEGYVNRLRRVTPAGVVTTYLPPSGNQLPADGPAGQARLASPAQLSNGANGNLLVYEHQYDEFLGGLYQGGQVRQVTPTGTVTTLFRLGTAGQAGYLDGPLATARFGNQLGGVVQDATGNVYVCDLDNRVIRKITPAGVVSTLAGNAAVGQDNQDGTGAAAHFGLPRSLTIDAAGNLYVVDFVYHNIRKITPAGIVTTLAGHTGSQVPNVQAQDGQGAAARFGFVWGITAAPDGTLYVVDQQAVRKVSATGLVTTLAGDLNTYTGAQVDGTGPAARFNFDGQPSLAVSSGGVVFVSESNANFNQLVYAGTRIRRIAPNGTVTTVVGSNETGYVNGPASEAVFDDIRGLAFTAAGTLVVADSRNHCLRQLSGAALLGTPPAVTLAGALRAYPNPASGGAFAAELPTGAAGQPATLALHDALGRVVWQQRYASAPATVEAVPTAALPAGLYHLRYAGPAGAGSCPVQVR